MACCFCLLPGDVRDYYSFEEKIGAGAFGQVRRARTHKTGKHVAIKIILRCEQGVTYEELMVEIECMKRLDHPNVVGFHGYFTDDRFIYIVMEEFLGGELMHRLRDSRRRVTEREAARYVKMMLQALEYLCRSEVSVVHRDIKPENFLFRTESTDSDLALIDFGLSQVIRDGDFLQTCCGTVQYISPEQIRGRYRFSGDMWAVGIVCYLLMVGKFPFKGESDSKMMAAILTKRASIPEECKMSEHAKDFVLKILEPDVAKRPTPLIALQHPWFSATEEVEISPAVLEAAGVESSKREVASDIEAERDENFNEQMQNRRTSRMSVVGRLSIRQSVSTQPGGGLGRASVSSTKAGLNPLFGDNMAESGRRSVGSRVAESFAVRRSFLKGPPEQPAAPPAIRKSKFHDTALNYAAMQFRKSNSIAMCGDVVQNFANGLDATTATLLTSSDGKGSPLRGRAVSVNNAMLPSALNEASRRKLPNIEMLQFSPERANNLHEKYEKGDREWTSSGGDKNNKGTS